MKQLKYRGDKTATITVGDVMGPDVHGQHHKVTSVRFDECAGVTHVETRKLAAPGQRIRFYGDTTGAAQPPQHDDDQLFDEIEAK